MASSHCTRRLISLSSLKSAVRPINHSSLLTASSATMPHRRFSPIIRTCVYQLGCVHSLLPLHSIVATTRMVSNLSIDSRSCQAVSQIDLLQEITQSPRILSEVDAALKAKQMKADVDEYLKTRQQSSSFLSELKEKLLLSPNEVASAGTRYNVPLINSLVLYVGMQAIQQLQGRTHHAQSAANAFTLAVFSVGAALDIFQRLIVDLDTEGRYLFLNAVANQLRYPNTHTHYFSFILLYLFAESNQEIIQEQITRVSLLIDLIPGAFSLLSLS